MFRILIFFFTLLTITVTAQSAPTHGDVRETGNGIEVWDNSNSAWISPDELFALEIKRLNGPTYGTVTDYPPYDKVQEWDTLIDKLPDGRECPMVFFHKRWRRLPDVLALDERLRNHGGCKDVFSH